MSETKGAKTTIRNVFIALGVICIVLAAALIASIAVYTSIIRDRDNTISSLSSQVSSLSSQVMDLQNRTTALEMQLNALLNMTDSLYYDLCYDEFGNVSFQSPSYNFSPPVSMYHAFWIALRSGGWNASSLSDRTVSAQILYMKFWGNQSYGGFEGLHEVTEPVEDYSPVQVNDTTYRYVWHICVAFPVPHTIPTHYAVDAATGEMVLRFAFPYF